MPAIIDQAGRKFNADEAVRVSRRHNAVIPRACPSALAPPEELR